MLSLGKAISLEEAERTCDPIVRNQDLNAKFAWDGKTLLDPMAVANPCGLIGTKQTIQQKASLTTRTRCLIRMGTRCSLTRQE